MFYFVCCSLSLACCLCVAALLFVERIACAVLLLVFVVFVNSPLCFDVVLTHCVVSLSFYCCYLYVCLFCVAMRLHFVSLCYNSVCFALLAECLDCLLYCFSCMW